MLPCSMPRYGSPTSPSRTSGPSSPTAGPSRSPAGTAVRWVPAASPGRRCGSAATHGPFPSRTGTASSWRKVRSGRSSSPTPRGGPRSGSRRPRQGRTGRGSSSRVSADRSSTPRSSEDPHDSRTSPIRRGGSGSPWPDPAPPGTSSPLSARVLCVPEPADPLPTSARKVPHRPRPSSTSPTAEARPTVRSRCRERSRSAASHSASPGAGPSSRTCGAASNSTPRAFPEVPSSGVSATLRSTPAWSSTGAGAWSSGSPGRGIENGSEPRSRTSWASGGRNPTRGSLPSGGRRRGTRSTAAGPGSCSGPTSTAPPSSFPPRSRSRPTRRAPSRSCSPPARPNG